MNSIDAITLKQKINNKEDFLLIDVREPEEHEAFNIGGLLIPLNTIFEKNSLIPKEKTVILYCQKGIRSMLAIQRLQQKFNYTNLLNHSGGMQGWKKQFNMD